MRRVILKAGPPFADTKSEDLYFDVIGIREANAVVDQLWSERRNVYALEVVHNKLEWRLIRGRY